MKLRTRLIASHGVVIALTILVFPLTLYAIHRLAQRMDLISAGSMRELETIEHIRAQLGDEVPNLLREALTPVPKADRSAPSPLRAAIDAARPFLTSPAERDAFADLQTREQRFEQAHAAWRSGQARTELPLAFAELQQSVTRLHDIKSVALNDSTQAAHEFARRMVVLLGALALFVLLLGLFATLQLVRRVIAPVDQLKGLVKRMSQGDFEIAYKRGPIDELNVLGRHFEDMGQALRMFRAANLERIIIEQRRSDAVLNAIGDGLVIFSEEGRIERINPVAERQLDLAPDSALGRNFEDIGDAQVGQRVRELLESGELAGALQPEMRIERDGETRILAYSLHRFVEGESTRAGVVMVMRDVTVQREFDKMRSEFVLRASHELRTPIASIRMGLGLLGEKLTFPPGSRDLELFETVQQELQRMVGLLADLLDLSRLRVGENSFERAPADIPEMLSDAKQRFGLAAADAHVALEVELKPGLPRLSLCRTAFDRVLDNLINNALRHTPAGGRITLRAYRTVHQVSIAVADTGEGIAYAQQMLIFQPFVQIGSKRGGAGLGLAICKEIVRQHGGEIDVASQPRRGSTFTISLPA